MSAPFKPITKEEAAEILGVSLRTIDNYIHDKQMPAPGSVGRRVYWHPEVFYSWLDAVLRPKSDILPSDEREEAEAEEALEETAVVKLLGSPTKKKSRHISSDKQSAGAKALRAATSRDEAC